MTIFGRGHPAVIEGTRPVEGDDLAVRLFSDLAVAASGAVSQVHTPACSHIFSDVAITIA